jgi:hypothetical protein
MRWLSLVLAACAASPAPPGLVSVPAAAGAADPEPADPAPADTARVDPAPAPTESCSAFPSDAELQRGEPGTPITIEQLIASHPASGRFTVEGYVQARHACAPCPEGAECKPCEESVWLSSAAGAYKGPMSLEHDLSIRVPDAARLELLGRYAITVVLCARHQEGRPLPDLATRGYRRL